MYERVWVTKGYLFLKVKMVDICVYDTHGNRKELNISPHTKIAEVFLFEDTTTKLRFISEHDRNVHPYTTIQDSRSNTFFALKHISSNGHHLIHHDPEESGSIPRMTSTKVLECSKE